MNEIRNLLFACAILVLGMEAFLLMAGETEGWQREIFATSVLLFFLLFGLLEHIFGYTGEIETARFFWLLPAALLFILLKGRETWPYAAAAVAAAAALRLGILIALRWDKVFIFGSFVLDAAAFCLFLFAGVLSGGSVTDKALFISLAVLTLGSLQTLYFERAGQGFPFHYFVLLAVLLTGMPMGREPIEWTPLIRAGEKLAGTVLDVADSISYYFSSFIHTNSMEAGYSSFDMTGERIGGTERTQLVLTTDALPYVLYTDEETGKRMKVRRTLYLTGGRGVEGEQLVRFLHFLHENGVDREEAALFSRLSYINVSYAYLDTRDEIVPAQALVLTTDGEKIEDGSSPQRHRKGYTIKASYLEIDYGSPYLISLIRQVGDDSAPLGNENSGFLSYEDICDYALDLYNLGFRQVMSPRDYEEILSAGIRDNMISNSPAGDSAEIPDPDSADRPALAGEESEYTHNPLDDIPDDMISFAGTASDEYLAVRETTARMAGLAEELVNSAANDYDKCAAIETYLRQFTYDTKAAGGHDPESDMTTPEGMADIADRFLFETQEGYCVHYTSAMVMLLRLAGVPARAVSGYRYDFPFERQEEYPVSSTCAHTWPEAYLPGIGWVPFEPTASIGTASSYTWHRRPAAGTGTEGEGATSSQPIPTPEAVTEPDAEEAASGRRIAQALPIILPVILSILILIGLALAASAIIPILRYRRSTPAQKLRMDVDAIVDLLRKKTPDPIPDRGLMTDYILMAPEEMREDLKTLFRTYYRLRYSEDDDEFVTEADNELARSLRERLREYPYAGK